jgi:SAM-dependent methyltransferase
MIRVWLKPQPTDRAISRRHRSTADHLQIDAAFALTACLSGMLGMEVRMPNATHDSNAFKPEDFDSFDLEVSFVPPRVVVPLLQAHFTIGSVVDIGCGPGTWLAAFAEAGVTDVRGYDGPYIRPDQLVFPRERYRVADLTQPLRIERRFDLACCLEVAEHLPASQEEPLVDMLTDAAPVILFSAGVPGQPGQGHVNLQWQSHWAELFARRGYQAYDLIRPQIWGRADVYWWYQQNIVIYSKIEPRARPSPTRPEALDLVHPALYLEALHPGGGQVVSELLHTVLRRFSGTRAADMRKALSPCAAASSARLAAD